MEAMVLKDLELRQINATFLRHPKDKYPEILANLSIELANDLKETRERLNPTSPNRSRPSGGSSLWEKKGGIDDTNGYGGGLPKRHSHPITDKDPDSDLKAETDSPDKPSGCGNEPEQQLEERKPGSQPGSQGFDRTQQLTDPVIDHHRLTRYTACNNGQTFYDVITYPGFYTLNLLIGKTQAPELKLTYTHHPYDCIPCPHCNLDNKAHSKRAEDDPTWNQAGLMKWQLVCPTLASVIVRLSFGTRLTHCKIQRIIENLLGLNCVSEPCKT